jgi:hypothetical protein
MASLALRKLMPITTRVGSTVASCRYLWHTKGQTTGNPRPDNYLPFNKLRIELVALRQGAPILSRNSSQLCGQFRNLSFLPDILPTPLDAQQSELSSTWKREMQNRHRISFYPPG